MMKTILLTGLFFFISMFQVFSQDYFTEQYAPYASNIPSPEAFLGYPVGTHHTRHDLMVKYFETLAAISDRADIHYYGKTYGLRDLVILTITSPDHLQNLEDLQSEHVKLTDPVAAMPDITNLPIFVQLGYNVHGNEPSGGEAALLTAYTLVASEHPTIEKYRQQAVFFVDPAINPDGRDRHTHWANMYKGTPPVDDPNDIEHNEAWPRGRTNHYWFDLNRDWWLTIHPESRGKLTWYHQWYPNVVTDFHEMGTNSTYFFEPMKTNGSKNPIMPIENYTTLNETFAQYFARGLDSIGSLYFTKEVFDGTYPGYGSSYPDLQGGLGLLFEQASSRGHVQKTEMGELTFAFTIRNQYVSSLATIQAAVENKDMLHQYQKDFFQSALENARRSQVKAYFYGSKDRNRLKAFTDQLLLHQVKVFSLSESVSIGGQNYKPNQAYIVPTEQPQYRIVQSAFETYDEYHDSVFYDASAWSTVNFYNMDYQASNETVELGEMVSNTKHLNLDPSFPSSNYAYLIDANDYNIPAMIQHLQKHNIRVSSLFKPVTVETHEGIQAFDYGSLMIPIQKQDKQATEIYDLVKNGAEQLNLKVYSIFSGYSIQGVDLGSRYVNPIQKPKVLLVVGNGVSSYEAGEVWHLLDQRVDLPITKVTQSQLTRLPLHEYNTLIMVSGNYGELDSSRIHKIKSWVNAGNTLITMREGTSWAIKNKLIQEELVKTDAKKDSTDPEIKRRPYINAPEETGREEVGGTIFAVNLDLTHPLAHGYTEQRLPVYRNSEVWLQPSKNPYCNVALYTEDPHVDGFITERNLEKYLKKSASIIVSKMGSGRAILFAENPNFRGAWYGTNRLFLNAIFLGNHIRVPIIPD